MKLNISGPFRESRNHAISKNAWNYKSVLNGCMVLKCGHLVLRNILIGKWIELKLKQLIFHRWQSSAEFIHCMTFKTKSKNLMETLFKWFKCNFRAIPTTDTSHFHVKIRKHCVIYNNRIVTKSQQL